MGGRNGQTSGAAGTAAAVVVCTRDRVDLLPGCLDSLDRQTTGEPFAVVVVDNGSTDGTGAWLARWSTADPARRSIVHEPAAGLSRARNRGLEATTADVVLFLDDDALAPRGWVAAHLAAHRRSPDTTAVGGPVVLTWPEGRPRWLTPGLEHWYSALDHGDQPGPFPPPHGPYGTNMSLRREAALAVGGFTERLGRRGRSLLSGEEADLWRRLWATGASIVYDPATLVLHRVTPARSSRRWLLRRGFGQGRTNARLAALTPDATPVGDLVRADARFAARMLGDAGRALRRFDEGAALDALARATGHTAAAVGHVLRRSRRG